MNNSPSKEQIINQAIKFHLQGNIPEASKYYQRFINQGYEDHRIFSNYGAILQDLNKLEEAETCYRKAIKINTNYAIAHSNLGNILRNLGKLKDAESSTLKAIKLKPDFAEAHFNLGNILRDLGKLKDAESSTLKAIKLKPDFAEAHFNLGNILRDLGKLKDAESSTLKAIKLKPDFSEAIYNLICILRDLGKIQKLILLTKSIPESSLPNQEYKLRFKLETTIGNLLNGNFAETFINITETKEFIKKGVLDLVKDKKNRNNTINYFKFITSLYPLLEKDNNNPNAEKIPHIGESHCLSFSHQTFSLSSQLKQIQPVLIKGGKAWHFGNKKSNKWKDSLNEQIKNHKYSDKVLISFGEIDCRRSEGILSYSTKNNKNISEVCKETTKNYIDFMEKVLSQYFIKRYYFGIPAPTLKSELIDELDKKRIKIIKLYNQYLKEEVLSRNACFLDIYALTSNKNGENNNLHMCDKIHLSPKCLSILFEEYLYET